MPGSVPITRGWFSLSGVNGKGDAVAIYLPMTPEAVVATYAVASIGAMVVPLFSGFAPAAIALARVAAAPQYMPWT